MINKWKTSDTIWAILIIVGLIYFFSSLEIDDPITGEVILENDIFDEDSFSGTSELHWDHMPLTYNYNAECGEWLGGKYPSQIEMALEEISNSTNDIVSFVKTESGTPDILFVCGIKKEYNKKSGTVTQTWTIAEAEGHFQGNVYSSSKIYIYDVNSCISSTTKPGVLIHEILHLFGFDDLPRTEENLGNIMFPLSINCNAEISEEQIQRLKRIYG
jgi:hypothetical protein